MALIGEATEAFHHLALFTLLMTNTLAQTPPRELLQHSPPVRICTLIEDSATTVILPPRP